MFSQPDFAEDKGQMKEVKSSSFILHSRPNSVPETSFDSGYCSPMHRTIKTEPMSPKLPMLATDLQVSPLKMSSMGKEDSLMTEMMDRPTFDDTSIASEWEKDFFDNFEENLFNFEFDDKTLDDILRSPKGKVAMNELMRSPRGKAIMNSPKGKKIKDKIKLYDTPEHSKYGQQTSLSVSPGVLSPSDPNILSATPSKPNAKSALKVSRRKLSLGMSGKEDLKSGGISSRRRPSQHANQYQKFQEILPKSILSNSLQVKVNVMTQNQPLLLACKDSWPPKEKLKFARDMFRRTLEKAVEESHLKHQEVSEEPGEEIKISKRKKKSVKFQEDNLRYPELKHALEKPSVSSSNRRPKRNRFPSIKLRESADLEKELNPSAAPFYPDYEEEEIDDDDLDEDYCEEIWKNHVPFTGYKEVKRRRNSTDLLKNHKRRRVHY